MEPEEIQEKRFLKAFNAGYLLQQYEPELLKRLLQSPSKNEEYFIGLRLGKKHRNREKMADQLKYVQNSKDKEEEKEPD